MTFDHFKRTNPAKCFLRLPGGHITGVLWQMPADWLVALAGEGVVLPRLDRDVLLLGVNHWRTELHVAHISPSFSHSEEEIEEVEGGKFGHD